MTQLTFFDTPPAARARSTDPLTSHDAAEKVTRSGKADSDRAEILAVVRRWPGLTAGEIAKQLGRGWDNVRVSRRTIELLRDGAVRRGESRVCSVNGTRMHVWESTP